MGKHTPGPWRIVQRKDGDANIYAGSTDVALCVRTRDARLIAAAPTMFDALESLIGLVEELVPEHDDIGEQGHDPENCSICEARIAIRKATGEE